MAVYDPLLGEISALLAFFTEAHTSTLFLSVLFVYFALIFVMIAVRMPPLMILVAILPLLLVMATFNLMTVGILVTIAFIVSGLVVTYIYRMVG